MISSKLSAELSATCNALGYSSGSKYFIDPYVKETITDLIRYLRRDDEDHTIRRHLGCAKILQTDLLPILIHHSDKNDLFDILLRLLVNLTNPALLIFQEELPTERTARHYYLLMTSQLQSYKEAFTEHRVWDVLAKKLGDLLQIEYHERDEDQSRTMERILILARNVLQVPADSNVENRPDNDASIHDQVLWSLHQAGMVDLFLYIASSDNEQQYYMHVLEIVSLMLREQNPATLASSVLKRSVEEKEQDEKELLEIRRREIVDKQTKVKKYAGTRHSRFGGTFVVKNVKSISEKDLIYHKPVTSAESLTFDSNKKKSKVPKNKMSLAYTSSERRSAFSVRLFLKEFCVEFLNGAYNTLMHKVRENLARGASQPNDETYFFWAMKFFMEFNRLYKFQVKLVSETMHQQIFHFVQTQMENWLEQMITDKKRIPVWSRRIHQALKAYQELLMTLQAMDKSSENSVRESSRVIKSNIFYQSEYRELVVFLFNVYNEAKFSKEYLKDLLETTHIFLKMLEQFCSRYQNVVVQTKARKITKKKKKTGKAKKSGTTLADMEAIWDQVGPELSAVLQGPVDLPDVVPFDAASDLSMDQQKVQAMKRIQLELKQGNFEEAISLLRASREVWPENDSFGHANMPPGEEFMAMRDIFMADIGLPTETVPEEERNGNEDSEGEEEDSRNIGLPEQSFKFIEFVTRFACPRVLAAVCQLLQQFDRNTNFTNHCIVKLLHRVAWDCKMPAMIFQASVFRSFQRIFKSKNPDHKELAKFAVFIMRKFSEVSKTNKKLYMEVLFWKTKREAEEVQSGYGTTSSKTHSSRNVWREEQEDELRRLAAEYERETPEPDAVGWIMKNMIDQTRTRRAVMKKMKELYLIVGNIKPTVKSKEFSEEEETELRSLYEQFKDAIDPMNCILGRMSLPRSRKTVTKKLIDMGLVSDRKQMRKKAAGKKATKQAASNPWAPRSDDESIYDSWSDSDGGNADNRCTETASRVVRTGQPQIGQVHCNLRRVLEAGMREPLEWLKSSLEEVRDDFEDEEPDEEGTALLPLTPMCLKAVHDPIFLQLLDVLCIDKPTDQEVYWRIPGRWRAQDLTEKINMINDALEGKLPDADSGVEDTVESMESISESKSSGKMKKKSPKNLTRNVSAGRNKRPLLTTSSDSASEQDNISPRKRKLKKKKIEDIHSARKKYVDSSDAASDGEGINREEINLEQDYRASLRVTTESDEEFVTSTRKINDNDTSCITENKSISHNSNTDESTNSLHGSDNLNKRRNLTNNSVVSLNGQSEVTNSKQLWLGSDEEGASRNLEINGSATKSRNNKNIADSGFEVANDLLTYLLERCDDLSSQRGESSSCPTQDSSQVSIRKYSSVESVSEDGLTLQSAAESVTSSYIKSDKKRKKLIINSDSDD